MRIMLLPKQRTQASPREIRLVLELRRQTPSMTGTYRVLKILAAIWRTTPKMVIEGRFAMNSVGVPSERRSC